MFSFFFFFSSRRRHTRLQDDWSSDVCSSDLESQTGDLFHLVLGSVAFAGRDLVLDVVVLLVLDDERLVIRSNQFHLQLAIGAVLLGVRGLVRDGVLIDRKSTRLNSSH